MKCDAVIIYQSNFLNTYSAGFELEALLLLLIDIS